MQFISICHLTHGQRMYCSDRIERFIDENKALMKRMYGDFEMSTEYGPPTREPAAHRRKRATSKHDIPDGGPKPEDDAEGNADGGSYFAKMRNSRQSFGSNSNQNNESGRCVTTLFSHFSPLVALFVSLQTVCIFILFSTGLMLVNQKLRSWHRTGRATALVRLERSLTLSTSNKLFTKKSARE